METNPFEHELQPDFVVCADGSFTHAKGSLISMEDFKRRLAKLTPEELLDLLQAMSGQAGEKPPHPPAAKSIRERQPDALI